MTPADKNLLAQLEALLAKLARGDASAFDAAQKLKAAAKRGDKAALKAWGTLAALYWGKPRDQRAKRPVSLTWARAEGFYERLLADEPQALARFKSIQVAMRSGGPGSDDAKKAFAMLKAIHNHRKSSVWYPGAPKVGYYPMPQRHRPGIVIGADPFIPGMPAMPAGFDPSALGQFIPPGAIPGFPAPQPQGIPGLPNIPGLPSQIPGFPGGIPGMPPGLGGPQPSPLGGLLGNLGQQIPGLLGGQPVPPGLLQSPEGRALQNFLPLTPQSVQGLLGMITQARSSPSNSSLVQRRDPSTLQPFVSTVPRSTATTTASSTVKPPSAMSYVNVAQPKSIATTKPLTYLASTAPKSIFRTGF